MASFRKRKGRWQAISIPPKPTSIPSNPIGNDITPTNKIPISFLKRDFDKCLKEGQPGQEKLQKIYCRCVIDRAKNGMKLDEYLLLSAELNEMKDASGSEKLKIVMSKEKLGLWVQDCVKIAAPYLN